MLLILKILGITLLVVLGLVLLILILVLCVPFRYEIRGRYDEKLKAKAGVSWLLKMIHVKVEAIQAQIRVRICVFGHAFKKMYLGNWGDNAPDAEKKAEAEDGEEGGDGEKEEKAEKKKPAPPDEEKPEPPEEKPEAVSDAKAAKAEKTKKDRPTPKEKYDEIFEELQRRQEEKEREKAAAAQEKKDAEAPEEGAAEAEEEDKTFLETAMLWTERISDFWDDEKNQKAVYLIERQLLKLGKHLVPTKFLLKGDLGLGDPAKTGQTIGKIYRFYPLFGDNIQLNGVFDEKRTDLYTELKGRIRLGILVEIAVRLLLNGRIRRWIRYFLKKDKAEEKKTEKKADKKAEKKAEKKAA